jgi:hypothetical protein
MILMYARVGRQGKARGKPFAATGWFAAGYLLAWGGFSLAATFLQWVIERAALLDSRMAIASINGHRSRTSVSPNARRRFSSCCATEAFVTTREAACCWGFGTEAIVSAAAGF